HTARDRAHRHPPSFPTRRSSDLSAASGAVGAVAGQLAKRAGARVVGIAGGADKCRWVEAELGFDACIDHRASDLGAALDRACPKDRKSTRLNSSHRTISYAVFCL